ARAAAAQALIQLGKGNADCVPPLVAMVEDEARDSPLPQRDVEKLATLGDAATSAASAHVNELGDRETVNLAMPYAEGELKQHTALRAAAARALGKLGDRDALSALRPLTADADPELSQAAKQAIDAIEAR